MHDARSFLCSACMLKHLSGKMLYPFYEEKIYIQVMLCCDWSYRKTKRQMMEYCRMEISFNFLLVLYLELLLAAVLLM